MLLLIIKLVLQRIHISHVLAYIQQGMRRQLVHRFSMSTAMMLIRCVVRLKLRLHFVQSLNETASLMSCAIVGRDTTSWTIQQ